MGIFLKNRLSIKIMQKSEKRTGWKGGCEWTDGHPNGLTGKQENKELNKKGFFKDHYFQHM